MREILYSVSCIIKEKFELFQVGILVAYMEAILQQIASLERNFNDERMERALVIQKNR